MSWRGPSNKIEDFPLSRQYHPSVRNTYEEKIAHVLIDMLRKKSQQTIVYTSFGAEMFYVLKTVTQVLLEEPSAHIAINLIHSSFLCNDIVDRFYKITGKKLLKDVSDYK